MADEVTITDRVQVDIEGLGDLSVGAYATISAFTPLEAVYSVRGRNRTRTVHGFTGNGSPLVFNDNNTHLVTAQTIFAAGWEFQRVRVKRHKIAGPFTPAPSGMVAVFNDESRRPIVFYDVHGRAVLIGDDDHRTLYLAMEDDALVRIEGPALEP